MDFFSVIEFNVSQGRFYRLSKKEAVNNFSYREDESLFVVDKGSKYLRMILDSKKKIKSVTYYYGNCDSFSIKVFPSTQSTR